VKEELEQAHKESLEFGWGICLDFKKTEDGALATLGRVMRRPIIGNPQVLLVYW